jgi:hypothetical protein
LTKRGADQQFPVETSLPGPSEIKSGESGGDEEFGVDGELGGDGRSGGDGVSGGDLEGGVILEESRETSDPVPLVCLPLVRGG